MTHRRGIFFRGGIAALFHDFLFHRRTGFVTETRIPGCVRTPVHGGMCTSGDRQSQQYPEQGRTESKISVGATANHFETASIHLCFPQCLVSNGYADIIQNRSRSIAGEIHDQGAPDQGIGRKMQIFRGPSAILSPLKSHPSGGVREPITGTIRRSQPIGSEPRPNKFRAT